MKVIYRILIVALLLSSNINFAQNNNLNFLNGMKYASYSGPADYEYIAISSISKMGLTMLSHNSNEWPKEAQMNSCLIGYWNLIINGGFGSGAKATLQISNCYHVAVYDKTNTASGFGASFDKNMNIATQRAFDSFKNFTHSYDESLSKTITYPEVENINMDEKELKSYFDSTKLAPIEGIYKTYKSDSNYKLGIIKVADKLKAIVIESDLPQWKKGDVKMIFESTALDDVFSVKYYMGDKTSIETFANLVGGLIKIEFENQTEKNEDINLLKLYPKK
jgi:hypothetical protein